MQLATYVRTIIMYTIILKIILYIILSCPSSMSCLFYSWTLCHFVCFFCFYLMLGLLLLNLSWCSCLGEKIVLICKYIGLYNTFSFSFSFLSFVSEKKKKKKLYLVFISTHACPLLYFILFIKSLLKKPGTKFSNLLDFLNSECTNF